MERPAHIPPKIWTMAKRSAVRFSSDAEVLRTAEMLLRRANGDEVPDEDLVAWWPEKPSKVQIGIAIKENTASKAVDALYECGSYCEDFGTAYGLREVKPGPLE